MSIRRPGRSDLGAAALAAATLLLTACGDQAPQDPAVLRMNAELDVIRAEIASNQNSPNQDSPLLLFRLGMVFNQYGYADSACAAFERSVAVHRAFPEAHFALGDLYLRRQMLDLAAASYEEAVRFQPNWVEAYNNLGYVYRMAGRFERARLAYERALELDGGLIEAYNNLAQVYKQQEKWDEAIRLYRKAISEEPMFREAYLNLAMVYKKTGAAEQEAAILQDIVDIFGTVDQHGSYAEHRLQEMERSGSSSQHLEVLTDG